MQCDGFIRSPHYSLRETVFWRYAAELESQDWILDDYAWKERLWSIEHEVEAGRFSYMTLNWFDLSL